jgi:hypothetical protein
MKGSIKAAAVTAAMLIVAFVTPAGRAAHACNGWVIPAIGSPPIQVDAPYPLGVAGGGCSGYANQSEGYVAAGTWTLKVKHGFFTKTYTSTTSPACALGVIEATDQVTATVTSGFMFIAQDQDVSKQSCP